MSPARAVLLLRRLSSGDSRLKNITVNQNREASISLNSLNLRDFSQGKRPLSTTTYCCNQTFTVGLTENLARMASTSTTKVEDPKYTNSLINSKSPYLLQHAHNPVNWHQWGEEAFELAKKENKLIFLSIGYSTCHWCHVMEKESFEDEETAKIMNKNFVNVKVDREERPDIDEVYMLFITSSSGRGGWPMSVFLTPELLPVAGGTYFPPEDRWGTPSFKRVLLSFAKKWAENREDFIQSGKNVIGVLSRSSKLYKQDGGNVAPSHITWEKGVKQFFQSYEPEFGGFGFAPKFPQPSNLNFLFHVYARNKNGDNAKKCLDMCLYTLRKMSNGGIHDHIMSGFARYSVDSKWHVPHFEKMLYDQAQLAIAYTDAYLATKNDFFADVVRDIISYVNRDLSHNLGGFYSAEDADSYPTADSKNKKEGAFCVWEFNEIEELLGGKTINSHKYSDIFCYHFNVKPEGNCEGGSDPHGELTNKNVLIILGSNEDSAKKFGLSVSELQEVLQDCKQILYERRLKRPRPHLDTKMLCSWNGLMISGLAQAGQGLGEKCYVDRAIQAANFVKQYLYDGERKILYRSCYRATDGSIAQTEQPILGFLNDYAFLIRGLVDLYQASLDMSWLRWAQELQTKQDELFWDYDDGGYYTSSNQDKSVVLRLKEDQDGAEPCGNSVSCHNLLRLSAYSDKTPSDSNVANQQEEMLKAANQQDEMLKAANQQEEMLKAANQQEEMLKAANQQDEMLKAENILKAFAVRMKELPMALPEMLSALMFYQDSPMQVLIAGGCEDPRTLELVRVVRSRLLPGRVLAVADPNVNSEIAVLSRIRPVGDTPTAYVCRRFACSLPVTDVQELEKLLDESTLEETKQNQV